MRLAPSGITPQLRQALASAHEARTWLIDQRELPASLAGARAAKLHFSQPPRAPAALAASIVRFGPDCVLRTQVGHFARSEKCHIFGTYVPVEEPSTASQPELMHRNKRHGRLHGYSITSSARASSVGGTSRPSVLAVLRLITSSNFVGCSTGRSAGFAPLRILST